MRKTQGAGPKKARQSMTASGPKRRKKFVSLNVLPDELWLKVPRETTIYDALKNTDIEMEGDCGGLGKCGKCKVRVLTSIEPPSEEEKSFLTESEINQGIRLACRTPIRQDMVIHVGEAGTSEEYFQILQTGERPIFQLDPIVNKHLVTLPAQTDEEGISDFDRIKLAIGTNYPNLEASFHCLRKFPDSLKQTGSRGAAVMHNSHLLDWQSWEKGQSCYGLTFDLGTTTLVGKLVNMTDGSEMAVVSRLNSQTRHGTNVLSRLQFVKEHVQGMEYMHALLLNDINRITRRLLEVGGLEAEDIFAVVVAGNTTMQHFFLGLNPLGIAEAPFAPVLTDGLISKPADVGLQLHPEAVVATMPVRSGYIGGDLISVILASGAAEQDDEMVLGIDIGTNGEIFLGNRKRILTCSAAAGPALEGARLSHGMIAKDGAIEAVGFEKGKFYLRDVGNIPPKGLCGSGLVDLVAVLLQIGIIDYEGLIVPPWNKVAEPLRSSVINRDGVNDFLIATPEQSYNNKAIYLTQKDVRELQLAKAAIGAGIAVLIAEMGITVSDIDKVYLAGALGNYVNPDSAMRIGLLPQVSPEIITSLGNAASTGASMALLSKYYWNLAEALSDSIEHIELSSHPDFNQFFVEHIDFPKEEMLDFEREGIGDVMKTVKVSDVMAHNYPVMVSVMPVKEIGNLSRRTGHHGFPVLDEEGNLIGMVTLADLENALRNGSVDRPIGETIDMEPLVAYPNQSLYEVMQTTEEDYGHIPVVDPQDRRHLLGVLRRHDIIRAYRNKVSNNPGGA
ncbi:MAG: ASKHA domain-containing protein [Dehalococcoidia bacterium]